MKSEGNKPSYARYLASNMAIKIVDITVDLCYILHGLNMDEQRNARNKYLG